MRVCMCVRSCLRARLRPQGFFDKGDMSPWGTDLLGNTGATGAEYIRVRMPFNKSIELTVSKASVRMHANNVVARSYHANAAMPMAMATINGVHVHSHGHDHRQ